MIGRSKIVQKIVLENAFEHKQNKPGVNTKSAFEQLSPGVKPEPLKVDDNIDKKVSEKRLNTDSYQSFLDELQGINADQFMGVSCLYQTYLTSVTPERL